MWFKKKTRRQKLFDILINPEGDYTNGVRHRPAPLLVEHLISLLLEAEDLEIVTSAVQHAEQLRKREFKLEDYETMIREVEHLRDHALTTDEDNGGAKSDEAS